MNSKNTEQRDGKHFCDRDCLNEYIKSTMQQCANEDCEEIFERKDGCRAKGQWYCTQCGKEKKCNTGVKWSDPVVAAAPYLD